MGELVRPDSPAGAVCRRCAKFLDADDNFCRRCGTLTEYGAAQVATGKLPPPASLPTAEPPRWTESPVVVLLALAVLLPLALGMLWRSRRFTRAWKIGLTLVVLLATAALTWYAAVYAAEYLEQAVEKAINQQLR